MWGFCGPRNTAMWSRDVVAYNAGWGLMMLNRALLSVMLAVPATAAASVPACDISDVCAAGADPCVITGDYLITGSCTFDAGDRDLVLAAGSSLAFEASAFASSDDVEFSAGSVHFEAGSTVTTDPADDEVLELYLMATEGDIAVHGVVDLTRVEYGSVLLLYAYNGAVEVGPHGLVLRGSGPVGDGGLLEVEAKGDVTIRGPLDLEGPRYGAGGRVTIYSDADVLIADDVRMGGGGVGYGGNLDIVAGDITIEGGTISMPGSGSWAPGISLGGNDVVITSAWDVAHDGSGPRTDDGWISVRARDSLVVTQPIVLGSLLPGVHGGSIVLDADEHLTVLGDVVTRGAEYAGTITLIGGAGADVQGDVRARGGALTGGTISFEGAGDVRFHGEVRAEGFESRVQLHTSGGDLQVDGTVTAEGRSGFMGVALQGCDVVLSATSRVRSAAVGARTRIVAQHQIQVAGMMRSGGTHEVYTSLVPLVAPTADVVPRPSLVFMPPTPACSP